MTCSEELAVLEPKCGLRHLFIRDAQLCLPGNVSLLGLSALSDRELCSQSEICPALVSSGLAVHAIFLLCALCPPVKAICGEVPSSLGCGKPVLSWLCADALAMSAATCTAATSLLIHRRHSLRKVLWRSSCQRPSPSFLSYVPWAGTCFFSYCWLSPALSEVLLSHVSSVICKR